MLEDIIVMKLDNIWEQISILSNKIIRSFNPEILIGISRGGLVITRFLSDFLNINNIAIIGIEFYTGINEIAKKPVITQDLCYNIKNKRVLLVDDVADTGISLQFTKEYLLKKSPTILKIATIHYKPRSIVEPEFYVEKTSKWIVYPWEYLEFSRLFYKKKQNEGMLHKKIIDDLLEMGLPNLTLKILEMEFKK